MSSRNKSIKLPGVGRLGVFHEDAGQGSGFIARMAFDTNLSATVCRNGQPLKAQYHMSFWDRFWGNIKSDATLIDLGSGLVTNVGVQALANEAVTLASPSGARINLLFLSNFHISGTSATSALATDIKIGTISTQGGQTAATGAQTFVSAPNSSGYKTVGTLTYTGAEAVTEWALLSNATVTTSLGSPFTAGGATTGTVTGTPLTASSSTVQGQQQQIMTDTTNATPMWMLVTSNTTSVATGAAWYKIADGTAAGATPANTDTLVWRPIMFDHKVFSALNVANTDTIQFQYTVTINSGG